MPTDTLATAADLDLHALFVPDGVGTLAPTPDLQPRIDYITTTYPSLTHLISTCTGAGVLDGRNATTNKAMWNETVSHGPRTNWIGHARWVRDGNVYLRSGVSAWIEDVWRKERADELAVGIEYPRITDWRDDPVCRVLGREGRAAY